MSIRTAVEREFLQMSLEILSLSTRKTMSVFSAVSKQVTFLAEAYFVRRLKGTSFTTALGAALILPWPWRMALSCEAAARLASLRLVHLWITSSRGAPLAA